MSFPKELEAYGVFRFLTNQCAFIQMVSALLHVLAHFIKPLRGLRDLFFTGAAVPVGSVVVYTFWLIWFTMGRETIFPSKLDAFYPLWLNHANHTLIVPINLLLALVINHKHTKLGEILTLTYMLGYTIFLHVVKAQTGMFIYNYIDQLDSTQRMFYFAGTGLFSYSMYKFGEFVSFLAHGSSKQTTTKKSKSETKKRR